MKAPLTRFIWTRYNFREHFAPLSVSWFNVAKMKSEITRWSGRARLNRRSNSHGWWYELGRREYTVDPFIYVDRDEVYDIGKLIDHRSVEAMI